MIPQRITLENFLSFGESVTLAFTGDETLWVLSGPNGVGKSAVFDAITFALFGRHRGGYRRVDELIRHGAAGFKVVFEFHFDATAYRITRGYRPGRHMPPKLETFIGDEWRADTKVTKIAELELWVEDKLGMGYDAFITSVLLKQGEADKLFSSSRSERIEILKKIIGFEQYQALADRVSAAAKCAKDAFAVASAAYEANGPVEPMTLIAATLALDEAQDAVAATRTVKEDAVRREGVARQWEGLEARRQTVTHWLDTAKARSETAATVRMQHARFKELESTLPVLTNLAKLQSERMTLEIDRKTKGEAAAKLQLNTVAAKAATEAAQSDAEQARTTRDTANAVAADLARELPKLEQQRSLAQDLDMLSKQVQETCADLPEKLQAATTREKAATSARRDADAAVTQTQTRLEIARTQLSAMEKIQVGVKCSRCRQEVTAEHALFEKAELTAEVRAQTTAYDTATAVQIKALQTLTEAKDESRKVAEQAAQRERLVDRWRDQKASIEKLGVVRTTAELSQQIEADTARRHTADAHLQELTASLAALKAAAAAQAQAATTADAALRKYETELASITATLASRVGQITQEQARLISPWTEADIARLPVLTAELAVLVDTDVVAQERLIRNDEALLSQKGRDRTEITTEIEAIELADRRSLAQAQAAVQAAATAAAAAEPRLHAAQNSVRQLEDNDRKHRDAATALRLAERAHTLHKKLDGLVGDQGLIRSLIRDAERDVVDLADRTLRQLTNHDLSLELDDTDDKTFALQVRKASEAETTSVEFISGSQRFRVAVSLALAIGQFAAGKRRPIEAVIIDEGFGGLDEDGLRSMAENLQELRRTQSLKRIILVSHQTQFTDLFPNGYKLRPSPTGTIAERI